MGDAWESEEEEGSDWEEGDWGEGWEKDANGEWIDPNAAPDVEKIFEAWVWEDPSYELPVSVWNEVFAHERARRHSSIVFTG
jgi:hypothetical protein